MELNLHVVRQALAEILVIPDHFGGDRELFGSYYNTCI